MYIVGDQKISLDEAKALANEFDTTVEELAAAGGWSEEGKTTVPEETTPPTEPEKTETSAGESSSGDTLLESPERNNKLAREILQARAAITKENSKVDIGVALFNLEQLPDGSYRIKTSTSTLDAVESQVGTQGVIGFRQAGGVDSREFTGQGILAELGQENYDLYMSLSQGSDRITAEQLEQIDLDKVDENVINSVVAQRRQKEGELIAAQFGQDKVEELRSELPTEEQIEASFEQAEQEAEVLQVNKAYLDSELKNFEEKKKAIEEQGAELKALVERRKEIAESIAIVPGASGKSVEAYNNAYQLYSDAVNDYNSYVASEEVKALGEMAARLNQAAEVYNNRMEANAAAVNKTIEDAALSSVAVKSYNATDRIMFELEDSILGSAAALMGLGADFINYLVDNEGVSEALDNFKGRTTQYSIDLENKRIKEMPLPITDEDVESGKATYADQIVDIALNNSATILTVMVPTSAAGTGARIAGTVARKTATAAVKREIRKRAVSTAARLSGGLFFVMESGGEARRIEGQQREFSKIDPVSGKTELESLTEKLEKGDFSGNQEKRNIESRIDLLTNALNVTEAEKAFSVITKGAVAMYAERLGTLRTFQNAKKWTQATSAAKFSKYVSKPIARWVANAEGLLRGTGKIVGTELAEEGLTLAAHNFIDITVQGENKSVLDGMDKEFAKNVVIPSLIIGGPGSLSNVGYAIRNEFLSSAQIKRQNAQIEKLFSIQERLESANMSEYDRQVLESKKMDLLREISLEEANALIDASRLDVQDIEILAGLQADLSRLRSQAASLGAEGASIKELNQINEEIADIVRKRDDILEKSDAEILERVKGAQDEAKAAMLLRSFERFNALGQISRGGKFVEIQTEEDFEKLPEELREKARAEEKKGAFGLNENGFSVVFNANAEYAIKKVGGDLALAAATVAVHEIGHTEIAGSGVLKDKAVAAVARGFINTLKENIESQVTKKRISRETANAILERFARYEQDAKSEDSVKAEELMMIISEMKALGLINKNSTEILSKGKVFLNALLNKITPGNRMFIPLNNLADVNAFLDRFQSKLIDGGRIQTAPDKETKESKGLLDEINALVPDTVQTQEDFFDRKVFNPIYNDGKLHPAIANYIRSRSTSQEEAQKIIESVADRLVNFNPAATRKSGDAKITFGEFLFSNVNFSKLDARKALFEEGQERAQTESVDSEQARQIQSAETTTTQQAEAPTYKNLLERRVLAPEVVEAIRNKVKSTVRVMKTRMDQPVSKNVTVKPYIAEIKKTMGKQADIDLKKAMGGLKDGQLRKFLLKHKAAILQNMTTTYLMTAMPNAVQKSVNGQFTSDWKGKKIDREKVTTDNAGRTSGAELVRRLPNAATRLSDEDFLSNFFTEDGKLIRGRKESLAKAMAEEISFDIISEALQDPNSEIRKALEQRQDLLGVELLDNYVTQVVVDIERGNVKASLGLEQISEIKGRMDALKDIISKQNAGNLTKTRLINALIKVFEDEPSDLISEKDIKTFANESFNSIKRYFSKPQAYDVDFATFVEEGNKLAKGKSNLMLALDIAKDALKGGYKALFEDGGLISRQRGLSLDFNAKLVASKGEAGLILALKWMRGHQTTSGKIGKGRMQIYAGVTDFIDNNLNTIPGVEVKYKKGATTVITEVLYNGKVVEDWKKRIESPAQTATRTVTRDGVKVKAPISKQTFIEQYDQRLEAAREAWTVLIDYLSFVNENGNAIDWVMTMMSLKSNMSSMLKAAAPVKYYHNGAATSNLRYEHVIPTEYMVLKLTQHFKGKAIDLDALRDKYNVAIIPIKMDDNFNILVQSQMNSDFDLDNDIEVYRYYNRATLGFKNMESIEVIGGDMKGRVIGESWIKFNESVNVDEAVNAIKNIKEVENQKSIKLSKGLSEEFNNIIERKTGVDAVKTFSRIQAQLRGKRMGRFKFFIAPSADDFRGLVHYAFAGKGKQGEADMAWFEEKLLTPYFKGIAAIDAMRQQIKREFRTVTKQFKEEYKMLGQQVGDSGFTYDHALRVYMWNRQGTPVEGLSKRDTKLLLDAIAKNPELVSLADALLVVARRDAWPDPSEYWEGNSVLADLNSMTEKIGRKKFLEEFIQNADAVFTEDNMNKIEALYGRAHKEAIEDSLYAMKNGTNRPTGANRQVNAWLNWINGSTGAIMFFNRRSALLQMLSFTNFINWSDNNPVKAAAAFANQKQYWKDFAMIFNSDKLKERRGGLKQDVSDSEIADVAGRSKNSPQAVLAYLLKIGFTPTQIADSMAIATGGAMFYRNRVNTYLKQGMDQTAAEEQAFLDFSKRSDEAQQSSDPALVSQQQRSVLGRLILAFANTPMQYTRLMKKAGLDLINGRGDWRENVSKIAYYGVVQNFIFSALQSALFALLFDDDEEDDEKAKAAAEKKQVRVINSMLDTVLRGSGIYGAVAATIKNTIVEYYNQEKKGFLSDHTYTVLAAAGISPPIQSKLRKIYSAIQTKKFEKDNVAARGWALTADGKLNLGPNYSILGNVLSGVTNVPMDRVVDELRSISEALDARNKAWQRIALALGWKTWDVGARNEEADLIKAAGKEKRKQEGIEKAKKTREQTRKEKKGPIKDVSDF